MTRHQHSSALPTWLALVVAFVAGSFMTTQARINGELAVDLDNGFVAASISFGSGFAVLCVIMLLFKRGRQGYGLILADIKQRNIPWWFTLAGCAGAGYVLSQSVVIGITGVALFTVAFVAGLTIGSLLLDLWGIGPAGTRPLTFTRVLGAGLGIVAVIIGMMGQPIQAQGLFLLVMPMVFGATVAWQQAANGRLTVSAGTPWTSTFINFGVGTGVLLIATAVRALQVGLPTNFPTEWWLYAGGPIGIIFIAANAVVVRSLGVLLLSLGTIAGQLTMAIVFDSINSKGHPLTLSTFAGTALIFVAVLIATMSRKPTPEPAA
jgi:transporter family-2 protein